jgi:hypothetical protein
MLQSMSKTYWLCLAVAVLCIGFVDTHTDETPIILGILLILSGTLGLVFPKRFLATWLVTGFVPFVTESLVGVGVLHAPWPAGPGISWPSLVALVPALVGAGAGFGIRKLAARTASV